VGWAYDSSGRDRATLFDPTGDGNNIDLGTLGGSDSRAFSINNNGQIVGYAEDNSGLEKATLFDPNGDGNNINLCTLGWVGQAHSINNSSQIVGEQGEAILFDPTGKRNNIFLGEGVARSINDNGQIVGNTGNSATLFDSTGHNNNINLNTRIDPASGWTLELACSINNDGWIVGRGRRNGITHAFLLKPVSYPWCPQQPSMDFNDDCKVDFKDFAIFVSHWLECNLTPLSACWE
jgi:probable HAF family extracellular repeat protein